MKFEKFTEAARHARQKKSEAERALKEKNKNAAPEAETPLLNPESPLYKYLYSFEYAEMKDEKTMDYRVYARRMWEKLIGEDPDESGGAFAEFENKLILYLHNIDVEEHIYPDVKESLAGLAEKYKDSVRHVALWSFGDVSATGYQAGKIEGSGLIKGFLEALREKMPTADAKQFFREKTSYMVADDKFERLADYAEKVLEENRFDGAHRKIKIVIIEDSAGNFDKARARLEARLGEQAERIEIVPVWARYSRKGRQEAQEASREGTLAEFEEKSRRLNAIDSFSGLLDEERFKDVFRGAHVFLDFDGVISNNETMRDAQAYAAWSALVEAAAGHWGVGYEEAREKIIKLFNEKIKK